ncbi:hypothetical protein Trydic_g17164 [Trypoxylus dichotomus]
MLSSSLVFKKNFKLMVYFPIFVLTTEGPRLRRNCSTGSTVFHPIFGYFKCDDNNGTALKLLMGINDKVDHLTIAVNELLRHHKNLKIDSLESLEKPADFPDLPFSTLEDFLKFEEKLKTNEDIKLYAVHRFTNIGGSGIESQVRRILKLLLRDPVACKYNWKGRDKISFQKTEVVPIIHRAIQKSYGQEGTILKVENTIKDWLKYARARMRSSNVAL